MQRGIAYYNDPFYFFTLYGFPAFTDSLALLLVGLVVGFIAPSLGVLFTVSYAALDLILSIHLSITAIAGHFVEYWLIWLLIVEIPLASRTLTRGIRSRLGKSVAAMLLGASAGAVVAGVLVYIWSLAGPILIRPMFTWNQVVGAPPFRLSA